MVFRCRVLPNRPKPTLVAPSPKLPLRFLVKIRTIRSRLVFSTSRRTIHTMLTTPLQQTLSKQILTFLFLGTFSGVLFAQQQSLQMIPQPRIASPARISLPQTPQNLPTDFGTQPPFFTLTQISPAKLEQQLRQVCGHRFTADSPYQYTFFTNRNNTPRQCSVRIDPQANRVVLSGDPQLCDQVFQLITALDQPPPLQGMERKIVPYQHTLPEVLAQALEAHRIAKPRNAITISPLTSRHPIQQVTHQFEGGLFEPAGINPVQIPRNDLPGLFPMGLPQPGDPAVINVAEEFRFVILDNLDVVILNADGAQVARFTEMIRQLEELSKLNRPKIEVVYLKHVNNVSLGFLINQENRAIYTQIFRTVQGDVRILPMTSPNAILLIGWGDSLEIAKELLKTLDQPNVPEHSRLHIFKLKHISAAQARTTLAGAFPTPPGMSGFMARIQLFADQRSNALIVQAAPNDLEEAKRILHEIDVPDSVIKVQVKNIRLKHSLAPEVAQTLSNVISDQTRDNKFPALELLLQSKEGQRLIASGIMSDVSIATDVRNNVIIIKAPESCMAFMEELIALLDIASPEAEIKIFQIEHGDAGSMVSMLTSLIPSNTEGAPGPRLPGSANEETLIPIRFAVDARSNNIVASGAPGDLKIVEALVNAIDREDQLSRQIDVYPLKNMKAVPIANTINRYITNRLQIQNDSPGVISPYQQIESAVIVVADEESNSLIISATPKYYEEIVKLIREIDKSPPQVVIKVLIVEVTLSDDKEWAAELGLQDPILFGRGKTTPGLNFNNPALPLGNGDVRSGTVASQMLSNLGATNLGSTGFGGLVFRASSDYLNIMIRALHEKKQLEVLGSPTITATNNQTATISVGQIIPRYQGMVVNQGVSQPNFTDMPVSLDLGIVPTISPEGTIVMNVLLKKEKLGPDVRAGEYIQPSIDNANLQTVVSAANNQTVVLGGLITKDESKLRRKVPLLGDIPVLGKMFRFEVDQTLRKELLVILTPRIVKDQDDSDQVRQMEYARMNWCLNNVVQVHGDIGAYSVVSDRPYTGNAPILTPGPVKMEDLEPILAPTLPAPILPKR